ncbi:MAG: hypothetical protein ISS43_01435 [Candidatus Omnitrophica bacterium]|nr:hypothetical protein [Candidatus Omnitrophota bacterium]
MLNFRQSKCLKITAILIILTFVPAQTSWAGRGRRGGNSTGALVIAAIGGAAMPLTAYIGATLYGPNTAYLLLIGTAAGTVLSKAGVDPRVNAIVTAAITGLAGQGLGALSGATVNAGTIIQSVVTRIVMAEVSYELSKAGLGPLAGLAASGAGMLMGVGFDVAAGVDVTSGSYQQAFMGNLVKMLVREGVMGLVRLGVQAAAGDNNLALQYGSNITSLAGTATGYVMEGLLPEQGVKKVVVGTTKPYEVREHAPINAEDYAKLEEHGAPVFLEVEDGKIKIVEYELKKDKQGKYHIVDKTERLTNLTLKDKVAWEKRGYEFRADPRKGEIMKLDTPDTKLHFVWDKDYWQKASDNDRYDHWQSRQTDRTVRFWDSKVETVSPKIDSTPIYTPRQDVQPKDLYRTDPSRTEAPIEEEQKSWFAGLWKGFSAQPAQAKAQPGTYYDNDPWINIDRSPLVDHANVIGPLGPSIDAAAEHQQTIGPYAIADAAFTPVSEQMYSPGVEHYYEAAESVYTFNSQLGDFAPAHITGDTF